MGRVTRWLKEVVRGHIHPPRRARADRRSAVDRRSGIDRRSADLRAVLTDEEIAFLLGRR